jgi:hypothetical protein
MSLKKSLLVGSRRRRGAVEESYATWLEKCLSVHSTYCDWVDVAPPGRARAFNEYIAALDHEERAASHYQSLVEQLGHVGRSTA